MMKKIRSLGYMRYNIFELLEITESKYVLKKHFFFSSESMGWTVMLCMCHIQTDTHVWALENMQHYIWE